MPNDVWPSVQRSDCCGFVMRAVALIVHNVSCRCLEEQLESFRSLSEYWRQLLHRKKSNPLGNFWKQRGRMNLFFLVTKSIFVMKITGHRGVSSTLAQC